MWEPFPMTPTSTRRKIGIGISYSIDFIIVIAVISWTSLVELGVVPHYQQGFYCDDKSIDFKYEGDTITVTCLVISVFVPVILMWITELVNLHDTANTSLTVSMKSAAFECGGYTKYYIIGLLGKLVLVEAIKTAFGELRPHFLDTCKPDHLKDCQNGLTYIKKYSCTGYDEFGTILVTDSSRSFPSGHASISFFEAIFMIWYFKEKFPKTRSYLLLPFIQCLCACWAFYCGVSRITDHRHHWWDVFAGSIFGVIFSIYTCTVFCKRFKKIKLPNVVEIPNQNGTATNHHHTSIKRLISDSSVKEEVTLNNVTIA